MNNKKVFCVRDIETGKLVSNLTSRSKKFWCTKTACQNAIANSIWQNKRRFEVVEYALVEIKDGAYNPQDLYLYKRGNDNNEDSD